MRRLCALLLVGLLGLALAACGSDGDGDAADTSAPPATNECGGPVPSTVEINGPGVGDRCAAKAEVEVPDPLPTELYTEDLVVGDGAEVTAGSTVTVEYVGILPDGTEFDSSWNRPSAATFPLAEGQLIEGWLQGIPGMKVGGTRLLVVPGELAYGPEGRPPEIGPDQTLVFLVEAVDVEAAPPTTAPAIPGAPGATGVPPTG
jgi:peptidylprolyl isomerase